MDILIIGCGNMGAAIASGILLKSDAKIFAVDPDLPRARSLLPANSDITLATDLTEFAQKTFELAIISVKPHYVGKVLEDARDMLADAVIISIAAGVTIDSMQKFAPPGARLVRAMPNLPASVNAGMTVAYADQDVDDRTREVIASLFRSVGRFTWLDRESYIDLATAVAGSGPGYTFAFVQHLADAGERLGLPKDIAAELARQTAIGVGRMLETDPRSPAELKSAVTSPAGTTAAGLSVLERNEALSDLIAECVAAAAKRAHELNA